MDDHKTKENSEKTTHKKCVCSSLQGLFIPNRQLSVALSACIAMLFFSFVTGYFFGGQHAAQDFMHHVDHVSFNDQMSASLCALTKECTVANTAGNDDQSVDLSAEALAKEDNGFQECVRSETEGASTIHVQADSLTKEDSASAQAFETKRIEKKYYAQLIGFGTQQAAQRFVKKLAKKQIPVEIVKHCSRTAQGKTINWYQVVTMPYEDKQQLLNLVDSVQKTEKIQDARIVAC